MSTQEIAEFQLKVYDLTKQIENAENQAKDAEKIYKAQPEFPTDQAGMEKKACYGTLVLSLWRHHSMLLKKRAVFKNTVSLLEEEYQLENTIAGIQDDLQSLQKRRY
ncbi:hypothetical protein CAEBREN_20224 [Caenorhabditis brenneri]|uniref:Uncharacterized protein n=1 Tax=Caenorhabditis brenneri TaxID=135651 RepID=G0MTH7_CAEBE|nr:hypothetical protein CAEBREN_20224 [Caenorhabditis brenneri]